MKKTRSTATQRSVKGTRRNARQPPAKEPPTGASKVIRTVGRGLLYTVVPGAGLRKVARDRRIEEARQKALLASGRRAKAEILAATPTRKKIKSGDGDAKRIWELSLNVQPTGKQQPFDVTVRHGFALSYSPAVGETLRVIYNPADTSDAMVNPRGPDPAIAAVDATGAQVANVARGTVGAARPRGRKAPAAAPSPQAATRVEQLAKLAELRESGALSDAEFEAQKKTILES